MRLNKSDSDLSIENDDSDEMSPGDMEPELEQIDEEQPTHLRHKEDNEFDLEVEKQLDW